MEFLLFKKYEDSHNMNNEFLKNELRIKSHTLHLWSLFDKKCETISAVKGKLFFRIYITILTRGRVKLYNALNRKNEIVHSAYAIPANYKYRFLKETEYAVGPCNTSAEWRGRGVYPFVLEHIARDNKGKVACVFIRPENAASIKGAQKAGFIQCAEKVCETKRLHRFVIK